MACDASAISIALPITNAGPVEKIVVFFQTFGGRCNLEELRQKTEDERLETERFFLTPFV